ncbi:MAG: calcium-binding protein, partial [Sneathiella sp.]
IDAEDNAADINAGGGFDYVIVGSDAGVSFEASQANAEVVVGNVGNDILSNSGSIRVGLYGGDGDDQITSGVAGDYLSGGSGADTIEGGDGIDELSYRLSTGGVDVDFEIQSIAQDSYAHFALKFGNTSSSVSFNSEKTIATHDGPALTTVYAQVEENTDDWNASTLRISNGDSTESFAFISEQLIDLNAELSPIGLSNVVTVDTSSGGSGVTVYDSSGDAIGSYNFLGDLSDGADLSFAYKKSNGQLRFYVDGKLRGEAQWTSGLEVVAGHHGANGQTVEFTYDQSYSIRQDLGLFGSEDSFGDVITNVENVAGSDHSDDIRTDAADNLLEGEAGNDILEGRGGADTLDGGSGFDWVSYNSSNAAVEIDLDAGFAVGGDATGDVLYNVEAVEGSSFSDTLTGDSNNNVLDGREGGDILKGGAGIDAVSYLASEAAVEINLKTNFHAGGDAEGDDISEIENAYGSEFADSLTGDDGDNFLRGHTGDDVLRAGAGDDKYYFALGDGQDEIYDFDERIETVETQVETQVWVDTGESSGHWSTEYSTSYSQQTVEYDAGTDILQLAPGITSDDLVFELAGAKRNIERSNTLNLVSIIVGFCSLAMIL